ncbi:MAG: methionine ABC transporter ATP-binding protein, partial [Firmicutes bacterium]|nr:methionine ABC transporter ATP-binding protein [Bacillota bacterium]
ATSALDPTTTRSILALLKEINQKFGITIIVITHEMRVIEEICQRVAIIDNSRIAEVGAVADIFTRPKTPAAQRLVYPEGRVEANFVEGARCIRIVFDGRSNSSFEPVIAGMVLACNEMVNIIYANSKDLDGKAYGQIVVQLPDDPKSAEKILTYLENSNVTIEEVEPYA